MKRPEPDLAALERAHRQLRSTTPFEAMLRNPLLRAVLCAVANSRVRRMPQVDIKKLQANDTTEDA